MEIKTDNFRVNRVGWGIQLPSWTATKQVGTSVAFVLQGNDGGGFVTIPAGEYLLDRANGKIYPKLRDSLANPVNWTAYTSYRASGAVYDSSTQVTTPFTNQAQTFEDLGQVPVPYDPETGLLNGSAGAPSGMIITAQQFAETIASDNFSTGSAGWQVTRAGVAEFQSVTARGTIYATAGELAHWNIGVVDAWTISADNGKVQLNSQVPFISLGNLVTGYLNGKGFWVGKDSTVPPTDWKFHIGDPAGDVLYWDGTNLYDSGNKIGGTVGGLTDGWKVKAGYIESKNAKVRIDANSQFFAAGATVPTSYGNNAGIWIGFDTSVAKLSLYTDSNNYLQYNGSVLTWKAANTSLDASGNLTATSATLSGTITATAGAIGGWAIGASTLTGGNATLSSTGVLTLGTSNDVVIASASDATYRLWVGHATAASATFRVTKGGAMTATGGTFSGAITATSGTISGDLLVTGTLQSSASANIGYKLSATGFRTWNASNVQTAQILADGSGWLGASTTLAWTTAGALTLGGFSAGSDYIRDAADTFGLASTVTGGNDVRFWAGAAFASRASASLQIYEDGYIFAKDIVLAKGELSSASGVTGYGYAVGDPLLLLHFDGAKPFETDYYGSLIGHKGQPGTYSWAGTQGRGAFRYGKFNKGVQVAESNTNLITNPSWETNQTGWSTIGTWAGNTRSTAHSRFGSYSNLLTNTSGSDAFLYHTFTADATTSTISVWVRRSAGTGLIRLYLQLNASPFTIVGTADATSTLGEWERLVVTGATSIGTVYRLGIHSATGNIFYVDAAQAEGKTYVTPYGDGSLGTGHTWSGTDHASTSSRSLATLTYPASGNINLAQGSLSYWFWMPANVPNAATDFSVYIDANNYLSVYHAFGGSLTPVAGFVSGGSGGNTSSGAATAATGWHHVVVTWIAGSLKLYLDGAQSGATATYVVPTGTASTIEIGRLNGSFPANTVLDDICVLAHVLSLNEIKSIYYSDAPLMVGISNQELRLSGAGSGDVFGNANGLFARDADGNPSFGLLNGTVNATTWGGDSESFDSGDYMFGSNKSGKANQVWDASAGALATRIATTNVFYVDSNNLKYGSNTAAAATTSIMIAAGSFTYNGEAVTGGDTLLGDNSATKPNLFWDQSAGEIDLRIATTKKFALTSSNLKYGSDTSAAATTAIAIFNSNQTYNGESVETSDLLIGDNSASKPNLFWDKSAGWFAFRVETTRKFYVASDILKVGSDTSAAATTALSIFNSNQTYNGESVEASDLLIGNNSASKANILWDVSAGQLKFRSGTTTTLYLDTAGSLNFGGGNQKLDANGYQISSGTSYAISRAITFKEGANDIGLLWMENGTSSGTDNLLLDVNAAAGRNAIINIRANKGSGGGTFGTVSLSADGGTLSVDADGVTPGPVLRMDGNHIVTDTTNGTKIGTGTNQKLGFWNATPVVQQVLATGTGKTVDNVISFLQTIGLCKQS